MLFIAGSVNTARLYSLKSGEPEPVMESACTQNLPFWAKTFVNTDCYSYFSINMESLTCFNVYRQQSVDDSLDWFFTYAAIILFWPIVNWFCLIEMRNLDKTTQCLCWVLNIKSLVPIRRMGYVLFNQLKLNNLLRHFSYV